MKTHRDDVLTFEYPEHLKQKRGMYYFESKNRDGVLEILTLELSSDNAEIDDIRDFILNTPEVSDDTVELTIVRRGESGIRAGMVELLLRTQCRVHDQDGYDWEMMFPVGNMMANVSIVKTPGNHEEDQPIWEQAIRSIQLSGGASDEASDQGMAMEDAGGGGVVLVESDEHSPHVLLPVSLCDEWRGLSEDDVMADGFFDPFAVLDESTDVGVALGVPEAFGLIPIGQGTALVVAGSLATVCTVDESTGYLRLASMSEGTGDEAAQVDAALAPGGNVTFADTGKQWAVDEERLLLFDAIGSEPSADGQANMVRVKPATFRLFFAEQEVEGGFGCMVHILELRPQA
ncbi:MAG: hypothetical protein DHS20C16_26460 [Phycisphaerae bacterium]|nr:MAG: hypothetical protein DHS20C16_26460 [Phycisphaerae bacterium]